MARNRFRWFFFLSTNIEKIFIYLEDDEQIQLILLTKSTGNGHFFINKMEKVRLVYYIVP